MVPVPVDHYENFPVASFLCPPALRPAVVAIYHYARTADDIADEGTATTAQRLADLQAYRSDLRHTLAGQPQLGSGRWPQVFKALLQQVNAFKLPAQPLYDLLDAFEQDVHNPNYPDRPTLLDYCRRSANPIGRLLLHLYGINDARSLAQSDAVCTALQLINFWQDLSVDGPRGRCYVPEADRVVHNVSAADLAAARDSSAARQMVQSLCDWARGMMLEGAPLATRVPGRAGWELRFVAAGGLRILHRIEAMDHAALARRPALRASDMPWLAWRAMTLK